MRGLLLKDFYVMLAKCRMYILISFLFLILLTVGKMTIFIAVYPAVLTSMISVTLIALDEQCRWDRYSAAFPYSRAELVSSKYLVALAVNLANVCLYVIFYGIRRGIHGGEEENGGMFSLLLVLIVIVGLVGPAVILPFIYKLGLEKGRIAYMGVIMLACIVLGTLGGVVQEEPSFSGLFSAWGGGVFLLLCCLGSAVLFGVSWMLSVCIYRKKEL